MQLEEKILKKAKYSGIYRGFSVDKIKSLLVEGPILEKMAKEEGKKKDPNKQVKNNKLLSLDNLKDMAKRDESSKQAELLGQIHAQK